MSDEECAEEPGMTVHTTREMAAFAVAKDIITEYGEDVSAIDPSDVASKLSEHGWTWRGLCGVATDGLAYTGVDGDLVCIKSAGHQGTHVSAEGAMW